jgi:uncharacterized protein (TIGR04222 family)
VKDQRVFRTTLALPAKLPLLERAICSAASAGNAKLEEVRRGAHDVLMHTRKGLEERGYFMHGEARAKAHLWPLLLAALVPLFGAIKIVIGLQRDRPVTFLVMLTLVALVPTALFLRRPQRTRRGSETLDKLKIQHAHLQRVNPAMLGGADVAAFLPLAIGLWGVSALHGTPLEPLTRDIRQATAAGDSSSISSGCGGSSGSSCSGGGDGGGSGGGCGGCGGGGGGD